MNNTSLYHVKNSILYLKSFKFFNNKMYLILIILWNLNTLLLMALENNNIFNENTIKKNIEYVIIEENIPNVEKEKIIRKLQSALHSISKKKCSEIKIKEYQNIINNFPFIIEKLCKEKNNIENTQHKNNIIMSSNKLRQNQLQINQELIKLNQQLEKEQHSYHNINNSLISLPQQKFKIKKELDNINKKLSYFNTKKKISHIEKSELIELQTKKEAKKSKISELELAQLSTNNRQEISKLHIELLKKKYDQLNEKLQTLHIQLGNIRKKETTQIIKNVETIINTKDKHIIFPKKITQQIQKNHQLSESLKKQIQNINSITLQQKETDSHTLQVRKALSKLLEQAQWINKSPALGEILRAQISKLPKPIITCKIQELDNKMAKLIEKRLEYEEQINQLSLISNQNVKNSYNKKETLTNYQKKILNTQINIQKKLLNSLFTNCDIQILELTKLKISYEKLNNFLKKTEKATQYHLFWIADLHPINSSYPYKLYQDLVSLFNIDNLSQLQHTIKKLIIKNTKIIILYFFLFFFICFTNNIYNYYYKFFLIQSKRKLQKMYKNYFSLTLQNIFWSNIVALPIPILWITTGYILTQIWEYPILTSLGRGITISTPILWILIIISYLTSKNGLFTIYFQWEKEKIKKAFRYYTLYIIIIIFFLTSTITFNNYQEKEFYNTLGRSCFIILCISLTCMTYNIKQANLPLYINKYGSFDNIINQTLWYFMTIAPVATAIASCLGYLIIAQKLLIHLETSLIILLISSIIYYTIRSWALTQKHQIIFKYNINNKNKKNKKNIKEKKRLSQFNFYNTNTKMIINNTRINIDTISDQSLQLIRSILTLITLITISLLWSEFHSIFKFLEQIIVWDTKYTIQGVNNVHSITLKTLLMSIFIFFITTKIAKNLPSLLELTILQYMHLTPGSNYAITNIAKYTIMFLGITVGCSHIGIEWSKLQWLIAAIGVGLGFGLQEIFANFISGLIVLFEKPIRIGDTITISDLTGKITQINTRATTITDRDHKEIIIPNKEFITKKFINWSLSDTITRIVLKVPAPLDADITKVTQILLKAVKSCSLVLQTPQPEIFLINLEKGIPLFEIRIYTSNMNYRMLLRHQIHILIIHFYKKHGLNIPVPHIHINNN